MAVLSYLLQERLSKLYRNPFGIRLDLIKGSIKWFVKFVKLY
jgi:hypothetical protein